MSTPNPFAAAWSRTHSAEGGYSNNPADPGGATNHGITERIARAFGFTGDMRDLTLEQATDIAKRAFWDPLRLDEIAAISYPIAAELFDTNINMWSGAAARFLQRALNALNRGQRDFPDVIFDGVIGSGTIAALAAYLKVRGPDGERVMLACLNGQQVDDYIRQCSADPAKEAFFFGWVLARVVTPAG
jgi:lysozyme family protein